MAIKNPNQIKLHQVVFEEMTINAIMDVFNQLDFTECTNANYNRALVIDALYFRMCQQFCRGEERPPFDIDDLYVLAKIPKEFMPT